MTKAVFQGIVDICLTHADRLRWSMQQFSEKRPFSAKSISQLTDIELAVIDQFTIRFSKLQDAMGAKLLPAVLELTREEGDLNTFIDKLNRLEKIGALNSADEWLKLREMCNQFAHDYPDDPEIQSSLLNKAFDMANNLLNTLDHVVHFSANYR